MTGLDRYTLTMHCRRRQDELARADWLTTYLVLPTGPGMPAQVVSKRGRCMLTLTDYRADSTGWDDAGAVSAGGQLTRLHSAPAPVHAAFWRAEPIRGPLTVCLPLEDMR